MNATPDNALSNPEQFIADLQRQLAECKVERDEALEQQTATAEVLHVINSSPGDLAPVFSAILERATRLCEADFGIFLTYDGERFHTVALHNAPEPYAQFMKRNPPQPGPESAIGRILRGERIVRIDDVTQDRAFFLGDPRRRAIAALGRARSYVAVGLHQGEKLLGTLAAYRQEVKPFTDKQIAPLQNFAAQAVIAIENAGLLTTTHDALEQQSAAAEVLQIIKSSAGNLSPVFEAILDKALRVCEADFGTLWSYDGQMMRALAARGAPSRYLEFLSNGPHPPSRMAHQGLLSGEQVAHIADITTTDAYRDGDRLPRAVADLGGVRTLLAASLKTDARLIGVLSIYRQQVRPFSDRQIALLRNFADQAVIAMENARLMFDLRERTEELTQREAALRASEERYALAMRGINEGVYEWDVASGDMYYSPRVCDLVGLQVSELRTMTDWTERIHPDDRAGYKKAILGHFKGETDRLVAEYRYRYADGSWHWARQHGIALRNKSGRAYRVVGSAGDISDRKAGEHALREALEQQTATAEVLQVINSSPGNLALIFDALLEKACVVCGFERGTLNVYDGDYFRTVATHGLPEAFAEVLRQPRRSGPQARFLHGDRIVHIADLTVEEPASDDPVYRAAIDLGGVRTLLFVPLRNDRALLGYLTASRPQVRPFSEKEIALLENFAAQAVIAMENARLLGELRERTRDLQASLQYQTATSAQSVISGSKFEIQPMFETIVATATRLCDAEFALITQRQGDAYRVAATFSFSPDLEALFQGRLLAANRGSMTGRIAHEGEVVHIDDIASDPEYALSEVVTIGGARTMVGVPLLREGEVVGTINLARKRVEPFTERQIELIRTFADQAVIAIENARLLTETREALDQQTATAELLQVINSSPGDLAPVFDAMLEKAVRLCDAGFGALHSFDGEAAHTVAMHNLPRPFAEYHWAEPRRFNPAGLFGRAVHQRRTIHVADTAAEESYRDGVPTAVAAVELGGVRTLLHVLLIKEDRVLGIFSIYRQEVRPFTDKHVALLQNFAAQAVIAMENARLLTETREALEQQTATAEVLQVINSSPGDLAPVFNAVLEKAHRLCGATQGGLIIYEAEHFRAVATHSVPKRFAKVLRQPFRANPGSPQERLLRGEAFVQIPDASAIEGHSGAVGRASAETGIRTVLMVPLRKDRSIVAYITALRPEVRPFTDKQIALLQNFAAQAVIAMENARLLTETRERTRDLQESLEYQTATSDVLNVINRSAFDLETVLQTVVTTAVRLCRADSATIYRSYDGEYRWAAGHMLVPEYEQIERNVRIRPGPGTVVGRCVVAGGTVQILDAWADPFYEAKEDARIGGVHTMIGVPLLRDGAPIGVIGLARRRTEAFSEQEIQLVSTFADQAAIAIENARLLTETCEALEQQTATAEVLQVINSSPSDLTPVFDAMLEKATGLCDASYGVLCTYDGQCFHPSAIRGDPQFAEWLRARSPIAPPPGSPFEQIALGERFVRIADTETSSIYHTSSGFRELVDAAGIRTHLVVALRKEETLIGVIAIFRKEVSPFSNNQIALLENFAAQAVIAMENARLLDEIRQRQQELRVTFENMVDGVAMFDETLHLAAWNRNFQELLQLPNELLAKRQDFDTYLRYLIERGEFGEIDPEMQIALLRGRIGDHYSFERTRPDGTVVEVRHNPMPGGGIVLIYSDITERKRSEAEIRAARDAAEAAYRDLKAAQASLIQAEKMASLGQLTAGIAHEIKNPLNFVNNFAGLSVELLDELKETANPVISALDDDKRAEIDETIDMLSGNLDKIAEHGRRADNIVTSMLEHSRGGSGERRSVNLNALIEEALNLAYHGGRAQDQSFNITLERDYADTIAPIELVPQDITRVCLNVFGNGFYASTKRQREGGDPNFKPTLKVSTRDLGEAVEIHVRDNGIGIPPEIKDKLFQPFFTTKPTGEGTGLGLSISWDIVTQQHGGTITVDSRPGEYTELTIRLPRNYRATKAEAAS